MSEVSATMISAFESVSITGDARHAVYKCNAAPYGYLAVSADQLPNLMLLTNHALASVGSPVQIGTVTDFSVSDHPSNPDARLLTFKLASGATISLEISRLTSMLLSDNLMTRL